MAVKIPFPDAFERELGRLEDKFERVDELFEEWLSEGGEADDAA